MFEYGEEEKSFVPVRETSYEYGENNRLSRVLVKAEGQTRIQNYVFQSDPNGNWIKQIVTPENAYTTRKIEYYPKEPESTNGG